MSKDVGKLHNEAVDLALKEVEKRARKILSSHPGLDEFVMGMGVAVLTKKDGEYVHREDAKYTDSLYRFIDRWDEYLKLTGEPMRFTATGAKHNRW